MIKILIFLTAFCAFNLIADYSVEEKNGTTIIKNNGTVVKKVEPHKAVNASNIAVIKTLISKIAQAKGRLKSRMPILNNLKGAQRILQTHMAKMHYKSLKSKIERQIKHRITYLK